MTHRARRRARAAALAASVVVAATSLATASPAAAAPGPPGAKQYYFDQWDVPAIWASGARGQGVVIAELDTGVNASLPEFAGKILPGTDVGTAGGDGRTDRATDDFGHGTAMASIMVANPGAYGITGLAPDARILPVAIPLQGTTDASDDDQLPEAIRYAADHGAKIISMSLGGERSPSTDPVPCPAAEQEAVFYAMGKGAVLVAASGNDGLKGSPVADPGVCLGVVSVGATTSSGTVAGFSSQHPYLTMTAPGVGIASLSRVPGTGYAGDGTSQATAITSAALALAWSAHPELSAEELVTRLIATLQPGPGQTKGQHSSAYGYGTLAANRLVDDAVDSSGSNPVYAGAKPFTSRYAESLKVVSPPLGPAAAKAPTASINPGDPPALLGTAFWLSCVVGVGGLLLLVAALVLRRRLGRVR
ncbi:S8 family peptidase [Jatrophihabitans sp. YIM 134969]